VLLRSWPIRAVVRDFVTAARARRGAADWFDRQVGYPRWAWLVSQKARRGHSAAALPPLDPAVETEVTVEITPLRRGHLRFQGVTIARPDPLD